MSFDADTLFPSNPATNEAGLVSLQRAAEAGGSKAGVPALLGLNPGLGAFLTILDALDIFGGGGLKETPMTPEEEAKFKTQQSLGFAGQQMLRPAGEDAEGAEEVIQDIVAQAITQGESEEDVLKVLDTYSDASRKMPSVLELLQTGPVQPTPQEKLGSAVGTQTATFGTNEQLEQEKQTLIDIIREAGGEVGSAAVEGTADLGNLVIQAVTLGKGPQLEAVVPNIMDIVRGGIGGQLVFGGGQKPATVVGTGQTGLGKDTIVAVGGIVGTIADIFKQGGNLGTVVSQFPSILIDNLPGVVSAAASAGYAFTDDDKTTAVKMGIEPSILDGIDDNKTGVAGTGTDTATVKTGSTNLEDLDAGGPDTSILDNQTKTTTTTTTTEPEEIKFTMGSPQFETTTTRTGPTLATTLGQDQSQVKTTPAALMASLASDEEKIVTPAELAAILGSESTETIKTSTAPTLTAALGGGGGGGGGGFSLPTSGGMRSVSGGPGPTVDLDYLYDFYGDLTQPFQATEDEEDIVKAAEGGMIGNTDDFERILRLLRGA